MKGVVSAWFPRLLLSQTGKNFRMYELLFLNSLLLLLWAGLPNRKSRSYPQWMITNAVTDSEHSELEIIALLQNVSACLDSYYPLNNAVLQMRNPRHKGVPESFSKSHWDKVGRESWSLVPNIIALSLHQAKCCYLFSLNYSDAEEASPAFVLSAYFLCPCVKI